MYQGIVEREVQSVFAHLSRADYAFVLAGTSNEVQHRFAGDHAIGGDRQGKAALERWFQRLFRLFPNLAFTVHSIIVDGWPWHTRVAVEWTARVSPQYGDSYLNHGAHLLVIRWGKVVSIHAYEDSQKVAEACRVMAAHGIEEAAAAPIT